jgi:hypothetical protein
MDWMEEETHDAHQAVWDSLGRIERVVVVTLAGEGAPSGSRAASEHWVPRSTLQDPLERLLTEMYGRAAHETSILGSSRPR